MDTQELELFLDATTYDFLICWIADDGGRAYSRTVANELHAKNRLKAPRPSDTWQEDPSCRYVQQGNLRAWVTSFAVVPNVDRVHQCSFVLGGQERWFRLLISMLVAE